MPADRACPTNVDNRSVVPPRKVSVCVGDDRRSSTRSRTLGPQGGTIRELIATEAGGVGAAIARRSGVVPGHSPTRLPRSWVTRGSCRRTAGSGEGQPAIDDDDLAGRDGCAPVRRQRQRRLGHRRTTKRSTRDDRLVRLPALRPGCIHESRRDRVHPHIGSKCLRKSPRQLVQRRLRNGVRQRVPSRDDPGDRSHVDDRPPGLA